MAIRLNGLRKGDEHPTYTPVEYSTFTLPYLTLNLIVYCSDIPGTKVTRPK